MRLGSLTAAVWPGLRPGKLGGEESAGIFLLLTAVIYLLPLLSDLLDRYLMPVVPLLAAGILSLSPPVPREGRRHGLLPAAVLIAGFLVFSVCGTRDYLAWNRVRWQALDELTNGEHVRPSHIDGGFEFNGYHYYSTEYQAKPEEVECDTYQLTFYRIRGWTVAKEYHFSHWMPPYTGSIYVLKDASKAETNGQGVSGK
jgi:hypothetical protein